MSFHRYQARSFMKMINPRERGAARTVEFSAYNDGLSENTAPMTCEDIVDDENGERLSSSQVEIMIEEGSQVHTVAMYFNAYTCSEVDNAQFKKRLHTHLEEQASACTPHILIGFEINKIDPPELSNI
jgi:hypothetical protein